MKKIAVYAIAKNEEANVKRWLNTVKDADAVFVLDTGSTDNTVNLLREGGAFVEVWPKSEFRFDDARNASLMLVPEEFDLCICLDFDEVLVDGWRSVLDAFEGDAANYTLIYSWNDANVVTCSYPRLAIHKRHGFEWKYPAHEVLTAIYGSDSVELADLPITVVHLPSAQKPAGHYLDLLTIGYKENPDDPRAVQYLAREYMSCQQYAISIDLFARHVRLEPHAQFRSESFRFMASMCVSLNKLEYAESHLLRAISEFPDAREPYCELAILYYQVGEYESAIGMLRSALRILSKPEVPMIFKDEFYGHWPYHLLASCYYRVGRPNEGLDSLRKAVELCSGQLPKDLLDDLVRVGLNVHSYSQSPNGEESSASGDQEE
jgi:hypothetical protein